ncbi:unnamed protein product [Soboliphyme baturini]|uniref:Secreted protein n=1 Tax=Soboliphyme baturini TaxID=241478 RepID=A0A183IP72_9BILA|nr:unnamed protein product [Soboliphyme baturini]
MGAAVRLAGAEGVSSSSCLSSSTSSSVWTTSARDSFLPAAAAAARSRAKVVCKRTKRIQRVCPQPPQATPQSPCVASRVSASRSFSSPSHLVRIR